MANRVRMRSNTVFENDRITLFRPGDPKGGVTRVPATVGDEFETDVWHGKELARLGHAEPLGWEVDDVEEPALEPHHQVTTAQLQMDRANRATASKRAADKAAAAKAVSDKAAADQLAADKAAADRAAVAKAAADKAAADKAAADKAAAEKAAADKANKPGQAA